MTKVELFPVHVAPNSGGAKVVSVDMGAGTSACACSGAGAKQPPTLREFPVLSVAEAVALEREIAAGGGASGANGAASGANVAGMSLAKLMDNAGAALSTYVAQNSFFGAKVLVLCGSGNNGGDGWVAARLLSGAGFAVTVLSLRAAEDVETEPARSAARDCMNAEDMCPADFGYDVEGVHRYCAFSLADDCDDFDAVDDCDDFDDFDGNDDSQGSIGEGACLTCDFSDCNVIIDCLLGTGFGGTAVKEPARTLIERANAARAFRVACDAPSGMNADTGEAADACFRADATVTMLVPKRGLVAPDAARYVGALFVAPIDRFD